MKANELDAKLDKVQEIAFQDTISQDQKFDALDLAFALESELKAENKAVTVDGSINVSDLDDGRKTEVRRNFNGIRHLNFIIDKLS